MSARYRTFDLSEEIREVASLVDLTTGRDRRVAVPFHKSDLACVEFQDGETVRVERASAIEVTWEWKALLGRLDVPSLADLITKYPAEIIKLTCMLLGLALVVVASDLGVETGNLLPDAIRV
jgi:hypothetical protein